MARAAAELIWSKTASPYRELNASRVAADARLRLAAGLFRPPRQPMDGWMMLILIPAVLVLALAFFASRA
jgi:hypothetical protein